ncbi:uncharacterized protein LOC125670802 isoform X3 [Ostrea edulis]|uniref:uncharacterized protein LOC125670802 isoform X3 n=1 Tax=Ostrea edulis TaxID=37623 RepID=UPI002094B6C2|nr:uncharacterized protein LOC125670802 isoform X3 [Ostrea edulis]
MKMKKMKRTAELDSISDQNSHISNSNDVDMKSLKPKKRKKSKDTKSQVPTGDSVESGSEQLVSSGDTAQKSKSRKIKDKASVVNQNMNCESENQTLSGETKGKPSKKKRKGEVRKDGPDTETVEGLESISSDVSQKLDRDVSSTETRSKEKKRRSVVTDERQSGDEATEMESREIVMEEKMDITETNNLKTKKSKKKRKSMDAAEDEAQDVTGGAKEPSSCEEKRKKKKKHRLQHVEEGTDGENNETLSSEKAESNEMEEEKKSHKKKKEKKKKSNSVQDTPEPELVKADKQASEYLHQWASNKESWKFQKVRQVWLLKNMYSEDKVTNDDFTILLRYLDGMKGRSREVTAEQAEKIIEEDEDKEEADQMKINRARQIVQLLT